MIVRNTEDLNDTERINIANSKIKSLDDTYKKFRDTEEAIEKDLTKVSSDVRDGQKNFVEDSEKLIDETVADAKITYRRARKNLHDEYNSLTV